MKKVFLVPVLVFISVLALTLFLSNNGNAQFFSIILLVLIFLLEK